MSVRVLTEPKPYTIPVRDLRDGQIAEVVQSDHADDLNCIVQRVKDMLVTVGGSCRWSLEQTPTFRVRVLPNGTRLVVEDNE